jgi:hypothetical protein
MDRLGEPFVRSGLSLRSDVQETEGVPAAD